MRPESGWVDGIRDALCPLPHARSTCRTVLATKNSWFYPCTELYRAETFKPSIRQFDCVFARSVKMCVNGRIKSSAVLEIEKLTRQLSW